jgi:hypothetical protein
MSIVPGALLHLSKSVQQQRIGNITDLPPVASSAAIPAAITASPSASKSSSSASPSAPSSAASIVASVDDLERHRESAAAGLQSIAAPPPAVITTDVEDLVVMVSANYNCRSLASTAASLLVSALAPCC